MLEVKGILWPPINLCMYSLFQLTKPLIFSPDFGNLIIGLKSYLYISHRPKSVILNDAKIYPISFSLWLNSVFMYWKSTVSCSYLISEILGVFDCYTFWWPKMALTSPEPKLRFPSWFNTLPCEICNASMFSPWDIVLTSLTRMTAGKFWPPTKSIWCFLSTYCIHIPSMNCCKSSNAEI